MIFQTIFIFKIKIMFRFLLFLFYTLSIYSFNINTEYSKTSILKYNYQNFFKKPIEYNPYSDDIIFETNFSPPIQGKEQYKFIFNSLQYVSKLVFSREKISILSTRETSEEVEILWKINGFTRTLFPIYIEGISIYEKNTKDLLKSHKISLNVVSNPIFSFYNGTIDKSEYLLNYIKKYCPCNDNDDDDDNYSHPLLNRPIRVRVDN